MEEYNILVFALVFMTISTLIFSVVELIDKRKIYKRTVEHQKQWNKIKSENPPKLWDKLSTQYLDELFRQYPDGAIGIPNFFRNTVWYIQGGSGLIKSAEMQSVGTAEDDKGKFECLFLRDKNGKVFIKEADKVYPTYEEAEKALKESSNNA